MGQSSGLCLLPRAPGKEPRVRHAAWFDLSLWMFHSMILRPILLYKVSVLLVCRCSKPHHYWDKPILTYCHCFFFCGDGWAQQDGSRPGRVRGCAGPPEVILTRVSVGAVGYWLGSQRDISQNVCAWPLYVPWAPSWHGG